MSTVTHTLASAEDIAPIISDLELVLEGVNRGHAIISCLSIAILLQHPTIQAEELQSVVKEASQFICLLLEGTTGSLDENKKITLN